jgi:lipopolysaccharide biosynthesis regulator YciM
MGVKRFLALLLLPLLAVLFMLGWMMAAVAERKESGESVEHNAE